MKIAVKLFVLTIVSACNLQSCVLSLKPNASYRSEDNKGNYAFGYSSHEGTSFHEESGSHGVKLGTYGVAEADGTQRVVKYIADENGFRASVEVKDQDPHHTISGYHTAPILIAQTQPGSVVLTPSEQSPTTTESVSNTSEKTSRRIESEKSVFQKDDISFPIASESVPNLKSSLPIETAETSAPQPAVSPQQLPLQVTSSQLQNLPTTVLFVPVPAQQTAAYSRVHTYSVNGFVPVPPMSSDRNDASVSGYLPVQSGDPSLSTKLHQQTHAVIRTQIPSLHLHPVLARWRYLQSSQPRVQTYVPLFI